MYHKHERAIISVLSFVIPGLVMLWIFFSLGFAPWGDKTVLVSDMSSQNVDFFCALKNGDLFYSWSKVLGSGYIGVFSWFVSSPLSVLTPLVPNEAMPVGLMFLTVLKIALSGLTFSIFAQRRFPGCGISVVVCAVCYALMSYNAAYSMLIMWLDGVIWLPLILLAIERILAGRGAGPLIAALTVCFLSTWYISYMIGIFCAIYLSMRLVALKPDRKGLGRILVRFFGGAACALGLTAWMWLPVLLSTFQGKLNGINFSWVYTSLVLCNPILLLGQLLPGQYGAIDNSALPYVFCGTLTMILVLAHFSFWEPYWREKLAERVVLALLALSMILSPLDKVWHLFQRPNWFPYRYAFLFSFFLLYLAVQALPHILEWLRRKRGRRVERAAALLLTVFIVVEMGLNAKGFYASLQDQYGSNSYEVYHSYYTANTRLAAAAKMDAGDEFYRMGAFVDRGLNTPLAFGYPGITHYSSFYNYDINFLLKMLGLSQDWYWCFYRGSTPATDALLDIGYVISRTELPGYQRISEAGGLTLWKNPNALPLAFLAEGVLSDVPEGVDPFERLNNLYSGLLGDSVELFTPAPVQVAASDGGQSVFQLTGTGRPVYICLTNNGFQAVSVNDAWRVELNSDEASCVYCLGTPQEGEVWTVTVRHTPGWAGGLWECDPDVLHSAVGRLDKAEILSVEDSGRVRLTAHVDEGQTLVTTIPAEKGWSAYVDGARAETGTWLSAFLSIELPAGEHCVELRYTPPGLVPGLVLGGCSVLALALSIALRRMQNRKQNLQRQSEPKEIP